MLIVLMSFLVVSAAPTVCAGTLSASSYTYSNNLGAAYAAQLATTDAKGRWNAIATATYGAAYSDWSFASGGKIQCTIPTGQYSGTTTCTASAKPCGHCTSTVDYSDGSRGYATWDGANCWVDYVPAGESPFVLGTNLYLTPNVGSDCSLGTYDGANCFYMKKPATGFVWNGAFYTRPTNGNRCAIGTYDGANCYLATIPTGTSAFELSGRWYVTPDPECADGIFDGANCYIATIQGRPFIYNGSFYYSE